MTPNSAPKSVFTVNKEDAQRLADIGFVGISRNRFPEALKIFQALQAVKPDQEIGPVGQAMALMALGHPAAAHDVLRTAPQTPSVMAFDCMALAKAGDLAAASELNDELQEIAAGTAPAEMAQAALQ